MAEGGGCTVSMGLVRCAGGVLVCRWCGGGGVGGGVMVWCWCGVGVVVLV